MDRKDIITQRIGKRFDNELKDIQNRRIKLDIDKLPNRTGISEITNGITFAPEWENLKKRLIETPHKRYKDLFNNKNGSIPAIFQGFGLMILIGVIGIMLVLLMAIFSYGWSTITNNLVAIPATSNITNISYYSGITFGNFNTGFQQFQWLSALIIFGLIGGVFISGFLVKIHPAYFGIYVIFVAIALYISIFLSRAYESFYTSGSILGTQLQGYVGASWMILYLPEIMAAVAFIGAIFLFTRMGSGEAQI